MSRIQKIVARGKAQISSASAGAGGGHLQAASAKNGRDQIQYTRTSQIEVPREFLLQQRLVSIDENDARAARFQILRTKVLQQMRKKRWNALGISAPTAGSGKTLIAANLAVSIALEGNQSVLLVDMDLRKPAVHTYFGFEPESGVQDILERSATVEESLVNPGVERLVILPGNKGVLNSSAKISAPVVRELVDELKARYESRVVIFDLPPALLSDDVLAFMPYVDCSLMVVEAGATDRKELERCLEVMGTKPLLGTVLNKSDSLSSEPLY